MLARACRIELLCQFGVRSLACGATNARSRLRSARTKLATVRSALRAFARQGHLVGTPVDPGSPRPCTYSLTRQGRRLVRAFNSVPPKQGWRATGSDGADPGGPVFASGDLKQPGDCNSPNGRYGIFGRDRADHSALMPADLITLPHFSVSSAMSLPNSAGEPASTVPPRSASRALNFGIGESRVDLLVELIDDLGRRVLRSADAEPCARLVARHEFARRSGCPAARPSASRWSPPSARSLPALMCSIDEGRGTNMTCTCPPRRSVSAGAAPR